MKTKPGTAAAEKAEPAPKKMTPAYIIKRSEQLHQECQCAIDACDARTSHPEKIKVLLKKIPEEQLLQFPGGSPTTVLKELVAKKGDVCTAQDKCELVNAATLSDVEKEVAKALEALENTLADCEDTHNGLVVLNGKCVSTAKKARNTSAYKHNKVKAKLVAGKFGPHHAKTVAPLLDDANERLLLNPDKFDPRLPTMWSPPREEAHEAHPLWKHLEDLYGVVKESIDKKAESLDLHMAKNTDWGGCLGRVRSEVMLKVDQIADDHKTIEGFSSDPGSAVWLACCKPGFWRWGPHAWPLPGVGCWASLARGSPGGFLQLFPAAQLLSQGIALKDMHKFLETEAGSTYTQEHSIVTRMEEHHWVWVPFGWIAAPVILDLKASGEAGDEEKGRTAEKTDKGKKLGNDKLGHYVHVPFFATEHAEFVEKIARLAIMTWNGEYLQRKSGEKLWGPRSELWTKFAKAVETK